MKLRNTLLALGLASLPTLAAGNLSDSQKLDSLMAGQQRVINAVADEPLAGKNFGIEVNPFRLLALGIGSDFAASGSVSLFNVSRSAEIAIPLLYKHNSTKAIQDLRAKSEFNLVTADVHYRQFLGHSQNGFYLSGFGRLANLNGNRNTDRSNLLFDFDTASSANLSVTKFGVGVGLGYRIFSHRGIYWGTGMSFGRYLGGKSDQFRSASGFIDDDAEIIFDVEFLKFGWAF